MAKILLVDDDLHLLSVLQDSLTLDQHQVDAVSTGLDGWNNMQKSDYDLAILDWDLPDLPGIDLLKRYRQAGGTTQVMMLTGHLNVSDKVAGLDSGAVDYITKPFDINELQARVRVALRKSEGRPAPKALGTGNEELLEKADLKGTSLASRYEFLEVLGEGGIGIVFKARPPHLERFVAVKMVQKRGLTEAVVARFQQEARAISRMDHPAIASVYEFAVTERQQPYLVMEFIEGQALDEILAEKELLPLDLAIEILTQISDGMAHAHAAGVLHRDLKPNNIMVKQIDTGRPIVKIVDFGCAKLRQLDATRTDAITQGGEMIGSPLFVSPEQIKGKTLDERSDIYSLGCVAFQMLSGCLPHVGDDTISILFKHIDEDAPTLPQVRPDLAFSEPVTQLVAKMLRRDPGERYQSMPELKAALEQIQSSPLPDPEPAAPATPESHRSWWHHLDLLGKALSGKAQKKETVNGR